MLRRHVSSNNSMYLRCGKTSDEVGALLEKRLKEVKKHRGDTDKEVTETHI